MAIFFIILIVCFCFSCYFIFVYLSNIDFILRKFDDGNCIVCGKKGKGKDLFFNFVINHRKKPCYSNIQFNPKYCTKKDLDYLLLKDSSSTQISYLDFLKGSFKPIKKTFDENVDFYISDGGVFLPSQYHNDLTKLYTSLPVTYALSRHLFNGSIHANVQQISRLFDKLREQGDSYFICRGTHRFGSLFLTKVTYYDKYESAKSDLLPFKSSKLLSSKENRALFDQFTATNGFIKDFYIIQSKRSIKYNTREFHEVMYGKKI